MSSRRSFAYKRWRVLLLAATLTVGALAGSAVLMWHEGRALAETAAYRNAAQVALGVARDQERLIETAQQLLVGLAQRREIQTRDAGRCKILFDGVLRAFPMYLDILAARPSGEVFCAGRATASVELVNPEDVRRSADSGNATLGRYTLHRGNRKSSITVTAPAVDDAGSVQAVIVVALDLAWLSRTLVETPLPEGTTLFLIERTGMVLAHYPEPERWVGEILNEPLRNAFLGGGQGLVAETGLDGFPTLFAVAPLLRDVRRAADASVVVAIPRHAVTRDANRLLSTHLAALGILTLLLLVTAGLIADLWVVRPLASLTRELGRLLAGKAPARPLFASRHGALRPLARVVERLAKKFEEQWHETTLLEKMLARASAAPETEAPPVERAPAPRPPAPRPPDLAERARRPAPATVSPPERDAQEAPAAASMPERPAQEAPAATTPLEPYWGLTETPFGNASDPRFLFLAPDNEDTLMQVTYVVRQRRGCALLTGEAGCGKTTLIRALTTRLEPERHQVILLSGPGGTAGDLLRGILRQLGIATQERRRPELLQLVNDAFERNFWRGRDTVIVVDDAHLVEDRRWFEQMGLLLNLRTNPRSPVTIVLVGEPELVEKVQAVKVLDQRIAVRCHLVPLDEPHSARYIAHRLAIAGRVEPIFTAAALKYVFAATRGTPRDINNLCDSALMRGFVERAQQVDEPTVRAAAPGVISRQGAAPSGAGPGRSLRAEGRA